MPYELKTKLNNKSVVEFVNKIEDTEKRKDSLELLHLFTRASGSEAKMWGSSIIGFGTYHYKYPSGQEGDWMRTGFSPRKNALSLYIMPGYQFDGMQELLEKLGKHKLGKSCLYVKRVADIDLQVLEAIIREGLRIMEEKYEK